MKSILLLSALAAAVSNRATFVKVASAKDVQVSMRGHWSDTSLVAEACEAVAELEGTNGFWRCEEFIPNVIGEKPYKMATDALEASIPAPALPVASVGLHSRRFSPLVAAQFQLFETDLIDFGGGGVNGNQHEAASYAASSICASPAIMSANGKLHCGVTLDTAKALIAEIKEASIALSKSADIKNNNKNFVYVTPTDKAYPTDASEFSVVIYGIFGHHSTHDLLKLFKTSDDTVPFVFRHHPGSTNSAANLPMQGYGIFMDVKNTEYKTTDEREKKKAESRILDQNVIAGVNITSIAHRFGNAPMTNTRRKLSQIALAEFNIEDSAFKVPFWHMSRAPMQVIDYVMGPKSVSSGPQTLERLADLTANFPLRMGAVLRTGDDLAREKRIVDAMKGLWEQVSPGTCSINVNGQHLREEQQDFFHVLDTIAAQEKHLLDITAALEQQADGTRLSLSQQTQLPEMIHHLGACRVAKKSDAQSPNNSPGNNRRGGSHESSAPPSGPRYWLDNDLVLWINNVEKDTAYQRLRPSFSEVLRIGPYYQPLFPRRNVFNLVFVIDAADSDSALALRTLNSYLHQGFAARFGVIFVDSIALFSSSTSSSSEKDSVVGKDDKNANSKVPRSISTMAMAALRIATRVDSGADFIRFLTNYGLTESGIEKALKEATGSSANIDSVLASSSFIEYYDNTQSHARVLGFRKFPLAIFNGIMFNSLDRVLLNGFDSDFELVKEWVRTGELTDMVKDIYTWMMEKHGAVKRFQGLLNEIQYIRIPDIPHLASVIAKAPYLYSGSYSLEAILESNVLFLSNTVSLTEWNLIKSFLGHISKCGDACVRMRYSIIFVGAKETNTVIAQFIIDVLSKLANMREERRIRIVADIVSSIDSERLLEYSRSELIAIAKSKGCKLTVEGASNTELSNAHTSNPRFLRALSSVAGASSPSTPLPPLILSNGRVVPIDESFIEEDFGTLFESELSKIGTVADCFERGNIHALYSGLIDADDVGSEFVAAKLASVASVMLSHQAESPVQPPLHLNLEPLTVRYGPREGYRHTIEAAIDPTKRGGQRLVAMIHAIAKQVTSANIVIYLNPPGGMSSVSMTTFYRFVFDNTFVVSNPDFSNELRAPVAHFSNLPTNIVFTMGVDEPESWMVFADSAEADLDNIKLADVSGTLTAEYGLHSILITGKCVDVDRQTAPKSLPLVLQNIKRDDVPESDTTVMSNYAYFQLRARFGQWAVAIQPGEVAEKYTVIDLIETEANVYRRSIIKLRPETKRTNKVMVSSFSGAFVHMQVREVSPSADAEHISAEKSRAQRALAVSQSNEAPTLNIFSVASGHLYERFLRMMFHTVVKTAREAREKEGRDTRVKFWLIENFLSPRFKKFLPGYAQRQGFEYQFVSYHWPHWLRRQTQKQRTIWAYKILFLDVLFPLSLDKVIFVDADQIVRSDLHELYNMDLEGKPMAYTPFCRQNMNTETKGFRFWDSGFWVDHLRGSPYHISAIYVVDLKRLRAMYGGDQYRMVYEQLSADPNSLSNLDQDLPNYVQHQVPIFSLPEEWLWCETWCNGESKDKAKTIDLCNNPMTKTPKLENAKRIIPEWSELDESLGNF